MRRHSRSCDDHPFSQTASLPCGFPPFNAAARVRGALPCARPTIHRPRHVDTHSKVGPFRATFSALSAAGLISVAVDLMLMARTDADLSAASLARGCTQQRADLRPDLPPRYAPAARRQLRDRSGRDVVNVSAHARRDARRVVDNLRVVRPGVPPRELERLALLTYRSYAQDTIDFIRSLAMNRTQLARMIAHDKRAPRRSPGPSARRLIVGGHFGNWELGGVALQNYCTVPGHRCVSPRRARWSVRSGGGCGSRWASRR